jgi:hypothetical protein
MRQRLRVLTCKLHVALALFSNIEVRLPYMAWLDWPPPTLSDPDAWNGSIGVSQPWALHSQQQPFSRLDQQSVCEMR